MLEFYGVEEERREELVEHTRVARRKGWWEAYSDTLAVPLVGLEVAADRFLPTRPWSSMACSRPRTTPAR